MKNNLDFNLYRYMEAMPHKPIGRPLAPPTPPPPQLLITWWHRSRACAAQAKACGYQSKKGATRWVAPFFLVKFAYKQN
jgi:hypothetical protein